MLFKVLDIEFDYDADDDFPEHHFSNVLDIVWEADDEDDLVEEITDATGYCIRSIDYYPIANATE